MNETGAIRFDSSLLAVGLLALVCFGIVLAAVTTGISSDVDRSLDLWIHQTLGKDVYSFFEVFTAVGSGIPRVAAIVVVVLVLLVLRRLCLAVFFAVANAGASLMWQVIKNLVGRPRPHLFAHAVAAGGYSFPSGHATNAAVFATGLAILITIILPGLILKVAAAVTLGLLALLIALSRVVLGVHYPTDILAGLLLGFGWTCILFAVMSAIWGERTTDRAMVPKDSGDV